MRIISVRMWVCMCLYHGLPLEGELGLLLDNRTLGGKLVQQDGNNTTGTQKKPGLSCRGGPAVL